MMSLLKLYFTLVGGMSLTPAEERLVREVVYHREFAFRSGFRVANDPFALPIRTLTIPPTLGELTGRKYFAVMGLLERIADGGHPNDAIAACSLGFGLAEGGEAGAVCQELATPDRYDQIDPHWGYTPRRHWVVKLRESKYAIGPFLLKYLVRACVVGS